LNNSIIKKINELKQKHNAVIIAHNYQLPEVQDIADFVGDSLELSIKASKTDGKVIVFCGVRFMAETASILSPDKTILLPDINAGCPLANMITPEDVLKLKRDNPGRPIVAYVNTSAAVKSEVDVCCTSANSVKVISSLNGDEVLFVPDKYLADYTAKKTSKKIIPWNGYCVVHMRISAEDIKKLKRKYPGAKVMVHPECRPDVVEIADAVVSTSGMARYAKETNAETFIVGTEVSMLHRLKKENPDKKFLPANEMAVCENMKLINLEKVLWCLEDMQYVIKVPDEIRKKAIKSVNRMTQLV